MIGWNGLQVVGTIVAAVFGAFYGSVALLVVFARIHDRILRRLERKQWRTVVWNECQTCKRREVVRLAMYDADLGWDYTSSYETCWACAYHSGREMIIDLSEMSREQIRDLVPETYETGQVIPFDPRAPHCMGDGRARMRTASE